MAQASSQAVTDKLRAAIDAQAKVQAAAKDAAKPSNPQGSPETVTPPPAEPKR